MPEQRLRSTFYSWLPVGVIVLWVCVCIAGVTTLVERLWQPRVIAAADTTALERSWLFQSSYAEPERVDGATARWIIAQPKRSYALLNREIRMPLDAWNSYGVGAPQTAIVELSLHTPTSKPLTLTTAAGELAFTVQAGTRRYALLAQTPVSPVQLRVVPITDVSYDRYGFSTTMHTSSAQDARALVVLFRSYSETVLPTTALRLWTWIVGLLPLWVLVAGRLVGARWWRGVLTSLCVALPWGWELATGQPPSLEPVLTVVVLIGLRLARATAVRLDLVGAKERTPSWVVAAAATCFAGTHALAVSDWMLGVDFSRLPTWESFWAYLVQQRAAFPIPLLTVEYLAHRSGIPALLDIGVLTVAVRLAMLAGVLAALSGSGRVLRYGSYIQRVGLLLLCAGIAFVARYDDRNYWMAYDAYIGVACVTIFRALRSPLTRPLHWIVLGSAIAAADSVRPFMQLVLPALAAAAAVLVWRTARWRGIRWMLAPLVLSAVWHGHHVFVLEQWSWSNYAGFNLARAWVPTAYAAAVQGLPLDMNDPEWGRRSTVLVAAVVRTILADPLESVMHAGALLWAMLQIPVEFARFDGTGATYTVVRVVPWWVHGYRAVVGATVFLQFVMLCTGVWRRPAGWLVGAFERVIWITILCLTALSETGEQARFLAAFVPCIVYRWSDFTFIWRPNAQSSDT